MTISSQVRTAGPFTCNGSTTVFPFAFKVFTASDVSVVFRDTASGAEVPLVLNIDYTVSLNANQNANPGGSISTIGPAFATGTTLTLTSKLQYLQPTDLTNQGAFYPKVISDALDRLTIFVQQVLGIANRALKFPISDGNLDGTLPGKDQRKGRVLVFHETTGLPIAGPTIGDVIPNDYIGEDLPVNPFNGMRWYKPSEATTFVYYVDGDSGQWVQEPVVSADSTLELQLAAADSTVLVGGVEASKVRLSAMTPADFGAVAGQDSQVAIQNYIDAKVNAGFMFIDVSGGPYIVENILIDERANYKTIKFGKLIRRSTTGAGSNDLIRVKGTNSDVIGVRIEAADIEGFATYTTDNDADNDANLLNGQWFNGVGFYGETTKRCLNCSVGILRGKGTGKNLIYTDCVENLTVDSVYGTRINQHILGCRNDGGGFGAISTWPSNFNPSLHVKKIEGYDTRTLFDLSSVGSSNLDSGQKYGYANIENAVGRKIQGRTKVNGFWALDLGSLDVINEEWADSVVGYSAIDIENAVVKRINIGTVYAENMAYGVRANCQTSGRVRIGSLTAINCLGAIVGASRSVEVDKLFARGCYSPFISNQTGTEEYLRVGMIDARNWRRKKFSDFKTANPTRWTGVTIPAYPITAASIESIEFLSGVIADVGEDDATPSWVIAIYLNASSTCDLTFDGVRFKTPAPFPVATFARADGTNTIEVYNSQAVSGFSPVFANATGANARMNLLNSDIPDIIANDPFNGTLFKFGDRWLWRDSSNRLRISTTTAKPANDTSGTIIGTQS